jgi:hypothetical protein
VTGREFKPAPLGDRGFGQLAYDKAMRVVASTQADNISIGPLGLKQSLLTYALLNPGTLGQPFSLHEWLSQVEEQVPILYKQYYPEYKDKIQQPIFFDFRTRQKDVVVRK